MDPITAAAYVAIIALVLLNALIVSRLDVDVHREE